MKRHALLAVLPLSTLLALGCEKPSGDGPAVSATAPVVSSAPAASAPASAVASASAAPSASAATPGSDRRGGLPGMIAKAARDLPDLKDAQKATLSKIEDGLGGASPSRTEMKALHDDLMAGIRAGKIDAAKMKAHYDAIDLAVKARQDKEAEAINGIYAALEPAQRKALAAALRTKFAEREAKMAERMKGMPDGGPPDWTKRRLEHLTKDLGLDDAQQKSVGALLAKTPSPAAMDAARGEMKKKVDALLTAFEKDGFDAKKLDLQTIPGKKAHDGVAQHVDFVTGMLAVLKPEQREKLAASMDKPMGGPGGPGGERDGGGAPFAEEME